MPVNIRQFGAKIRTELLVFYPRIEYRLLIN